jgi:hypothetical protein
MSSRRTEELRSGETQPPLFTPEHSETSPEPRNLPHGPGIRMPLAGNASQKID